MVECGSEHTKSISVTKIAIRIIRFLLFLSAKRKFLIFLNDALRNREKKVEIYSHFNNATCLFQERKNIK